MRADGDRLWIDPVPFTDPAAQQLVAAALADLAGRYGGEGDETPIDAAEFVPPAGVFLVARRAGVPVGCAGWRSHDDGVAELKRLYAVPAARGTGLGRRLLAAIENHARRHGRHRLVLECGRRQPEALSLYARCGYRRIPNYGYYADAPDCVSFARDL